MNECRVGVKTNTKLIESEIHQLGYSERSDQRRKKKVEEKKEHQLIIIFLQHVSRSHRQWCLLIWCNLWSKFFSFLFISNYSLGQWNNEKAVCSYTEILFIPADPLSVYFVVDVMWPNNKSKWVFIHFKCFKLKVKSSWNVRRKYSRND